MWIKEKGRNGGFNLHIRGLKVSIILKILNPCETDVIIGFSRQLGAAFSDCHSVCLYIYNYI